MRVLVTGGAGFIGSHVVNRLVARGFEVFVYDLPVMRKRMGQAEAIFVPGSVLDLEALRVAMTGVDVVFHLAAIADVKDVLEDPSYAEAVNVRGTINVLEAARRAKVRRVIYGSTIWVYSDVASDEVDEETPLMPPSHVYTATKLASEYYCHAYNKLYGLEITILRYGIPYGPGARDGAVIPIFVGKALRGEPLTIAGDGTQFRKFIYVEDLAEGNVLALKPVARNRTFNLAGIERVTIQQIADTIARIIGPVEVKNVEGRPGDFFGKEVSIRRAREELGWEPKVSFEEGMRRYIEWYRRRAADRKADRLRLDADLRV